MNLSEGCTYCAHLISISSGLLDFECEVKPERKLENAGACFVISSIIVEGCPDFLEGPMQIRGREKEKEECIYK
jgi:hypothetical protein